jgi:hypothetical protein
MRVGVQILLGLPFAEEPGTIQDIRDDVTPPIRKIFILDDGDNGIIRLYSYPSELSLNENPETGQPYAVGDRVEQFAPLTEGVSILDYKKDPEWFRRFVSGGVYSEVQKYHRFGVVVDDAAYSLAGATLARTHILKTKPTYTYPNVIVTHDAGVNDVDVNDTVKLGLLLKLYEGVCLGIGFGRASMWDEPDPSPMKMSAPPDGGTPEYDHERLPGIFSGWQSAYDEPVEFHAFQQSAVVASYEDTIIFDGSNEYVKMGDVLGFERTDPFAISVWMKTTQTDSYLVSKMDASPRGYAAGMVSGSPSIHLISSGALKLEVRTTATFNDGAWHHVVFSSDGTGLGGLEIYVDGVDEALTTISNTLGANTIMNSAEFNLSGRTNGAASLFNGSMDEIAVYNKDLTTGEAGAIYNGGDRPNDQRLLATADDLLGYWPINLTWDSPPSYIAPWVQSPPYPLVPDATGSNDGIMYNMEYADVQLDTPGGVSNRSCIFDGLDEYVSMGNVLDFDRTDAFSISVWIKTTATGGYAVSKMDATPRGYAVAIASGAVAFMLVNSGALQLEVRTTAVTFGDGAWHHVVAVSDGTGVLAGLKIYVDDTDEALSTISNTLGTNPITNSASLNISGRTDGSVIWNGSIDEVAIYDKELSASEVTDIYDSGTPNYLDTPTSPSNLVGWWGMGETKSWVTGTMVNMEAGDIQTDVKAPLLVTLYPEDMKAPGTGTLDDLLLVVHQTSGWTSDATPTYEVLVNINGSTQATIPVTMSFTVDPASAIEEYRYIYASLSVPVNVDDDVQVVVQEAAGSTGNPSWDIVHVRLHGTYTSDQKVMVWGYDREILCPDELLEAVVYCDWPGGVPEYDNILFAWDTPIFFAFQVGGHVLLDEDPITWAYSIPLAAGTYGRRVTL